MGVQHAPPKEVPEPAGIAEYIRPYLLRNLDIEKFNQVWNIDITYISMA